MKCSWLQHCCFYNPQQQVSLWQKVEVISSLLEAEVDIKANEEHPSYLWVSADRQSGGTGDTNPVPFRKLGDTSFNLPPPLSPSQGSHFTKLPCTSALSALGTSRGCWSASQRPHGVNGGWNQPAVLGSNRPLIIRAAMTFFCSTAGIIGAATSCQHHQIYYDLSTLIKKLLQKGQTTKLDFSPLKILYF